MQALLLDIFRYHLDTVEPIVIKARGPYRTSELHSTAHLNHYQP